MGATVSLALLLLSLSLASIRKMFVPYAVCVYLSLAHTRAWIRLRAPCMLHPCSMHAFTCLSHVDGRMRTRGCCILHAICCYMFATCG